MCVCFRWIWLTSRSTVDLASALDYHIVLTGIVRKISMSSRCDLVSQLEHAIEEAVHEHHTNAQAIGLGIHCRIQKIFWLGKNNLYTPTWHSLNTASSAIGRLAPFMPLKRESCWKMLKAGQLDKMRETWETFVQEYVSIC